MQRGINLTFHGIGHPQRALEPGEDTVWVGRERFLELLDSVAGRTDVRITFDDGNASDAEHALPALRERGLTATFFVVAGRLGDPGFLDEAEVRELAAAGMGIGCHGMRHRPWRGLDERALNEELVDSRRRLEDVLGGPVTEAACPYGAYDRRALRVLRRSGYGAVFTSDRGTTKVHGWLQPRNTVHADDCGDLLDRIAASERPAVRVLPRRAKQTVRRWR